jgi:hypothetical protein
MQKSAALRMAAAAAAVGLIFIVGGIVKML